MKKNLLFFAITAILFVFQFNDTFAQQQQPPNPSFEDWTDGKPDNWNTSDYTFMGLTWTVVTKETSSPQEGNFSAKLSVVTKTIPFVGSITIPGVVTLGVIEMDPIAQTANITGGYPFAGTPQKLTGYFKYNPVNNDTCYMGWGLSRWHNGTRDTIGYGGIDTAGVFNEWTYFEIPLTYTMYEVSDTLNILFLCSNPLDGQTHTGSTLWIDNLSFVYSGVGIEGITFPEELKIYGTKDQKEIILAPNFPNTKKTTIELFNIMGKRLGVWKKELFKDMEIIDLNNYPSGAYIIKVSEGKQTIISRKISLL